jgi:rubredoxin
MCFDGAEGRPKIRSFSARNGNVSEFGGDAVRVFNLEPGTHRDNFAEALPHEDMQIRTDYCPECGVGQITRKFPMVIEWDVPEYGVGSDEIADFSWVGTWSEIMVSDRVRQHLSERTSEIVFGPVEMRQDPKLKRPKRITSRTKRRIWLPYEGPPLWDFIVPGRGDFEIPPIESRVKWQCGTCGLKQYEPPQTRQPLRFHRSEWDGSNFFLQRSSTRPWFVFVTELGRTLLGEGRFTNLVFRECGRID